MFLCWNHPGYDCIAPASAKLTSFLMQTSAVSALEAHSCFPRTNPAIVLILFPQLAPGCVVSLPQVLLHAVFLPSTWPRTKVSIAHGLRVTTGNENESLRLPEPGCSCCRVPSAQHYVESETAVQGCVGIQ